MSLLPLKDKLAPPYWVPITDPAVVVRVLPDPATNVRLPVPNF